jgi:Flp pilus assembly pilin Flp
VWYIYDVSEGRGEAMRLFVREQKGQNVVEYMILLAAVAAVLIVAVAKGSPFNSAVNGLIASPINMLVTANQSIRLQ